MYEMLRRVQHMVSKFELLSLQENADDTLILKTLLEDRANDVIKTVSESNWTSTCILTMGKFRSICKGSAEASAVLSYPSGCRKAQYFSIRKNDFIEDFLFPADGRGVNVVGDDGFVAGTIESHDAGFDIQKMLLHNPSNDDKDVEGYRTISCTNTNSFSSREMVLKQHHPIPSGSSPPQVDSVDDTQSAIALRTTSNETNVVVQLQDLLGQMAFQRAYLPIQQIIHHETNREEIVEAIDLKNNFVRNWEQESGSGV